MPRLTTLKKYLVANAACLLLSLAVQLIRNQDCSWDGCYPTAHITIIGSLFGLPTLALEAEIVIGVCIWLFRLGRNGGDNT